MLDLDQMQKRQRVLADFGEFALRSDDLDAVLTQACRLVAEALGTERAKLLEIEHAGRTLFVRAGVGWDEGIVGRLRLPMAEHSSETYSIELGEPVITNDLATEDRFDFSGFLKDAGVKAIANVPVFLPGGKPFGLLQVDSSEPRAFDDDDSQFLRTYATILGPMIDRLLKVQSLGATETKYRTLFEAIDEGFCVIEVLFDHAGRPADYVFLETNAAFERQTGLVNAIGKRMRELAPNHERHWFEIYGQIAVSGEPQRFELPAEALGRWYDVYAFRIGDPEQRRVAILFNDVAERKQAERELRASVERQAFLLALSDALRPLAGAGEIQATTTRLLGAHLGVDRAMYAEVTGEPGAEKGAIRGQFIRPTAPGRPAPAPFPDRFSYETFGADVMARRYSGRGLAVADVNADSGFDAAERAAWAGVGVQAAIVAPLVKDGRLVAELGVHSETPRTWTDAEVSLVHEVGERTWAAAERARAEAALRTSEQRYHNLFKSMDEAYAVVEVLKDETGSWSDFRFVEVNPAFMHHSGMSAPVGRTATDLLGTPNPRWAQMYGRALDTGEPLRTQESEPTLGRTFDLNIFSFEPPLNRVAVLFTDITERKRAERELRESEEKYRTLFDTIDSGYALTDNVRDEEGRVVDLFGVDFNRSYTHHSGLPPFAGRRASEVITVQPEWLQQFEEVTRTGVPARHENYIVERDRWVSTHYSLVGDLGSDRVAVVFDDITDRKRAEAALRESEERQAFLLKLSDALRSLSDPVAIQETASRLTAEHLDIGRVAYCEIRYDPEPTAVIERDWPRRDLPSMAGRHRVADFGAFLAKELPAGRPVVVSDARTDPRLSDTERGHWASLGVVASYNVPVIKNGRVAAYLVAHDNRPHRWTESEIAIIGEVGDRTWAAAARARAEMALRNSEERYAALFAASPAPVLILRPDAPNFTIADVNDAYLAATMRTREDLVGRAMFDAFPDNPDDPAANGVSALRASLERVLVSPRFELMEVQKYDIVRPDGKFEERWWKPANSPVVDDDGNVMAIIHHVGDVTSEHRAVEALRASEERLRTLMEGIPQLVWRSCDEGRWTWSSPQWQFFTGQSLAESLALGWLDAVHLDDRETTMRAWEAARTHGMLDVEYRVRRAADGEYLWQHTRSLPVRDEGGRVVEWLGTTTDVQQLKELQERQEIMVAELQHRTRNLIAVVRSIAQQTMAQTGPTEAFRDEFNHRLEALARVQGLLSRSDEEPITIEALIRMELGALGAKTEPGRIEIEGPPARIRSAVVQTLALALHELATNARKYGALSSDQGQLQVRWQTYTDAKGERLALHWTETGGQPSGLHNDSGGGYGRELIERALPYSLNARTSFELDEAGLRCTIDMPVKSPRTRRVAA